MFLFLAIFSLHRRDLFLLYKFWSSTRCETRSLSVEDQLVRCMYVFVNKEEHKLSSFESFIALSSVNTTDKFMHNDIVQSTILSKITQISSPTNASLCKNIKQAQ